MRLHLRLAALLLLVAAPAAGAQYVRGQVLELPSNRPVPDAQVVLWSDSITTTATTRTDSSGHFLVKAPSPGTYVINVRKVGYTGGQTGRLALMLPEEYEITIKTPRIAPVLKEVRVTTTSERGREWLQGFDQRRKAGFGTFLDAPQIDARGAVETWDIFRGLPGVDVTPGAYGRYLLTSLRGGRSLQNSACQMDVLIDGSVTDQEVMFNMLRPRDIQAIEVYNGPAEVPTQFKRTYSGSCGMVLIWTRIGAQAKK
jgi:hypothetical protein